MRNRKEEPMEKRPTTKVDYGELEWPRTGQEPDPPPPGRDCLWQHLINPEFGEGQVEAIQKLMVDSVEREMSYWGLLFYNRREWRREKRILKAEQETKSPKPPKRPRGRPRIHPKKEE